MVVDLLGTLPAPLDLLCAAVLALAILGAVAAAIASLRAGRIAAVTDAAHAAKPKPTGPWPSVRLIVPCRGAEHELARNLRSLAKQDYPKGKLRMACVVDEPTDDAATTVRYLRRRGLPIDLLVVSELRRRHRGGGGSGKVEALSAAVRQLGPAEEVLAFADSDIVAPPSWLRSLVAALDEPGVGVATTYRWYVTDPPAGQSALWWRLRSLWNAAGMDVMRSDRGRFTWGGTMVLRTSTFDEARVLQAWSGQVSDDVVLGRAVQSLGKSIAFVPDAVVYSDDPTDGPRLWEWCTRQVRLTRRYMPTLWLVGLLINLWLRGSAVLSVLVVGTEFLLLVLGIGAGSSPAQRLLLWAAAVGCLLPSLTVLRTAQRLAWWRSKGGQWGAPVPSSVGRTARLGPLEAALMTLVLLASARGRFITWRGRRYDLRGDRPPQTRP